MPTQKRRSPKKGPLSRSSLERDGEVQWTEGLRWGGGSNRGSNRGDPANTRINATTGGWGGRQAKARNVAKVPQNLDAQFFDRLIQNVSHTIV